MSDTKRPNTTEGHRNCKSCGIGFPVNRIKAERYEREAECPEWFCYDCGGEDL